MLLAFALLAAGGRWVAGQDSAPAPSPPPTASEPVPGISTGEQAEPAAPQAPEASTSPEAPPASGGPGADAPALESLLAAGPEGQLLREEVVRKRDAASALALGWAYFEKSQWLLASEWFDHALRFDPASSRAAEGVIMSAYRSGDLRRSYELATTHQSLVPDGRNIVAKAAAKTAGQAVEDGEVERAEAILEQFPSDESTFAGVRQAIADRRLQTAVARQDFAGARSIARENRLDVAAVSREESADLLQRAADARKAGQHREALRLVEEAETIAPLEPSGRRLKAWSLYQNRRYGESADLFEALYREGADQDSAEGLTHSLQQAGQLEELAKLNRELGGPLAATSDPVLLAAERAREEKERRQREQALASAPPPGGASPEMAAPAVDPGQESGISRSLLVSSGAAGRMGDPIDTSRQGIPPTSRFSGGGGYRIKSGEGGVDRLRVTNLPSAQGTLVFGHGGNQSLTLGARALSLESGEIRDGRLVGSAESTLDRGAVATETDTLIEPRLAYRLEKDEKAFFAEIGATPIGAELDPSAVGAIGMTWQGESAAFGIQGFADSVNESLLSYTGMQDPYSGRQWGRVVKTGVRADGGIDLGNGWGANGLLELSQLDGEGVAENTAVAASLGLSYEWDVPGFESVSIGPTFHFESYEKNLSQYTLGHGGYFSPDQLIQGMLGVNFLTETGGSFLAGGFVGVGAQTNDQAATPVLPLAPDGRYYGASSDSSAIFTARLQALLELNPQWRLGAQAGYAKTAAFDDFAVSLYMSFLFEPENRGLNQGDFSR